MTAGRGKTPTVRAVVRQAGFVLARGALHGAEEAGDPLTPGVQHVASAAGGISRCCPCLLIDRPASDQCQIGGRLATDRRGD